MRSIHSDLICEFAKALAILPEEQQDKFDGWRLVLDNRAKRRYGQCRYSQKEIGLSSWLIDMNGWTHPQVIDTLKHEMAHVLAPGDGHGSRWKTWAFRLGASTQAKVPANVAAKVARPAGYTACCPKCGWTGGRWLRRPTTRRVCVKCLNENRRKGMPRSEAYKDCLIQYRRER